MTDTKKVDNTVDATSAVIEEQLAKANDQLENVTVNDLIVMRNVIDVCSKRGAFKADELQIVGMVYNIFYNIFIIT